jgi:flagellar biosynthetic protein FliR
MITLSAQQIDVWLAAIFLPLVRLLAFIGAAPIFGHMSVPVRVKVGLALAMTVALAPHLLVPAHTLASAEGVILIAQQFLVGVAMGFTLRVIIAAIELAGEMIGMQMGLNFAGFFDPQTASQGTPIGAWLGLLALLVFLAANGHLVVLDALADSFRVIPIRPDAIQLADWRRLALVGAELFRIGLYVSLPVVGAMLVCNIALGVLARVAPQLNVLVIGFPVTILVGFTMLLAALPFIVPFLETALGRGIALISLK